MSAWGAIFDWDGVILDSSAHHEASWKQLAVEEGRVFPEECFARGYGMKNETIMARLLGWTQDPQELSRMSQRKEVLYRQLVRQRGVQPLPGVESFVARLHAAAVPCAVGSSTPRLNITYVMDSLAFNGTFRAIVASEDVSHGKPDPEVFLLAAQRLDLPADRCVVFEDTPVGLEAARAAGMKAVAVCTTHAREHLRTADRVVERLDELQLDDLSAWFVR